MSGTTLTDSSAGSGKLPVFGGIGLVKLFLKAATSRIIRSLVGTNALVKQASDRRIIDPAGTSHVQKKANVFRQIRDSILSPQMSNSMSDGSTKPQNLAKKQMFFENFSQFSD